MEANSTKELVKVCEFVESLMESNPKLTVTQLDALFSLGREHYWNQVYQKDVDSMFSYHHVEEMNEYIDDDVKEES
jgi:hypothetical protein